MVTFAPRTYDEVVRDLLTTLTGGTATEVHPVPTSGLTELRFGLGPVRRVSHVQGFVDLADGPIPFRFTERDFDLVEADTSTAVSPAYDALVFGKGQLPAERTDLTVNYYPVRTRPTPINDVSVGSVVRTLLETIGREIATQNQQLAAVYDSAFVDTAKGIGLDNTAALVDVRRIRARHPIGRIRLSRRPGESGAIVVAVGTAVTDGEGNRYLTTDRATMQPGQSIVEVWVHGETAAAQPVDAGALTVLERAIAGIDRATNDEATFRAAEDETDDQFRRRARAAIHTTGRGTLDAIRAGVEALDFVSSAALVELPDGVPGKLRVDVAMTEDTAFNRAVLDRRIRELRPAGILVTTVFAGKLELTFEVALTLTGSFFADSVVDEILDDVRGRLAESVRTLAPGATMRRSRLLTDVLADDRIVDAAITIRVAGAVHAADTFTIPSDLAVQLDEARHVTFVPVSFEDVAETGSQLIAVDVEVTLTLLDPSLTLDAARARVVDVIGPALASATELSAGLIQTSLNPETGFVAAAADTIVSVEPSAGQFVELRPGDTPFAVPAGSSAELRDTTTTEAQS